MLGVSEKAQGRGIGSTLLAVLLATAKKPANLRRVQLTVLPTMRPRSASIAPSASNSRACAAVSRGAGIAISTPIRWPSFLAAATHKRGVGGRERNFREAGGETYSGAAAWPKLGLPPHRITPGYRPCGQRRKPRGQAATFTALALPNVRRWSVAVQRAVTGWIRCQPR